MRLIGQMGIATSLFWCFAIAAGHISAKTIAFTCPVILVAIYAELSLHDPSLRRFPLTTGVALFATFGIYAFCSLAWTPNASKALPDLVYFVLMGVCTLACIKALIVQPQPIANRFARATYVAFGIGLVYLAVRHWSNGSSDIYFVKKLAPKSLKVYSGEVTRAISPVTLLLGPAVLWVMHTLRSPLHGIVAGATAIFAAVVVATSPHETSKLALVAGVVAFVFSLVSAIAVRRLLCATWVIACFFIIPLSIAAREAQLQDSSWLQPTAQQRILIWDVVARKALDTPLLGHGFNATRLYRPEVLGLSELRYAQKKMPVPLSLKAFRADHPHNVYLQIWFELGAIGAALVCALGLKAILALDRMSPNSPYLLSTVAAAQTILLSSYGAWQSWFVAMFALSACACAASIALQNSLRSD